MITRIDLRNKSESLRKYRFADEILKRFTNKKKEVTKASAIHQRFENYYNTAIKPCSFIRILPSTIIERFFIPFSFRLRNSLN